MPPKSLLKKPLVALLLTTLGLTQPSFADPAPQIPAKKGTNFIRVDEDPAAARLQTAITTYEKDGHKVDLIGAVHIADKKYFETLNAEFDKYPVLLFEMVGGENIKANLAAKKEAEKNGQELQVDPAHKPKDPVLANLGSIYGAASRFLSLSSQADVIDYNKAHFVHADLTQKEFLDLQNKRGESLLGFALKSAAAEAQADPVSAAGIRGLGKKQPSLGRIFGAILAGNSNALKLEMVHTLSQGDDQISAISGESVIITDRNAKCLEVLDAQIKEGHKKIGIFYGAAHYPDMEKTLLKQGYKKTKHQWITAWDIPKKTAPKKAPATDLLKEAA